MPTVHDRIQSLQSELKQLLLDICVAARSGARSIPSPDYLPERPRTRVIAFLEAAQHGLSQAGYAAMNAQIEADYELAKMQREIEARAELTEEDRQQAEEVASRA